MDDSEFIGRVNVLVAKQIKENCKGKRKIDKSEIAVSQAAMVSIGMALKQISQEIQELGVFVEKINTEVYDLNGDLIFIIDIPEAEADMVVAIPFGYWKYNNEHLEAQ